MLGESSGGSICRADCRFLGIGSRLQGRAFCLCVAGGPWVIERCAISISPLPRPATAGDPLAPDGAPAIDDRRALSPCRWDHLVCLHQEVHGEAADIKVLDSLAQMSSNDELLGGKSGMWGWGRCDEVVGILVVSQAQLVVCRSDLSGGVRLTDKCNVMLEDCHVADTGSRDWPNVDGIAFDGSAVGVLKRCLFTNHSRAAVAVCGDGEIEAVVDTCEFVGNSGSILHADYYDASPWRIRTSVNLKLLRSLILDGLSLWRGDRLAPTRPSLCPLCRLTALLALLFLLGAASGNPSSVVCMGRFLVGEVTEEDNFICDTIPRSFIREGCGGFSGVHLATGNVSRAAAMRGADCASFLPFAHLGDAGIFRGCDIARAQYLATNLNYSLADFEKVSQHPDDGAKEQAGEVEEEDEDEDESSEIDEEGLAGFQAPTGARGPTESRGARSVFGGGKHAQVNHSDEQEEDSEARERARLKAIEDAEIDMDHFKRLVRHGHNISGTGAELAELLGIEPLEDSGSQQEAQTNKSQVLAALFPRECHVP